MAPPRAAYRMLHHECAASATNVSAMAIGVPAGSTVTGWLSRLR